MAPHQSDTLCGDLRISTATDHGVDELHRTDDHSSTRRIRPTAASAWSSWALERPKRHAYAAAENGLDKSSSALPSGSHRGELPAQIPAGGPSKSKRRTDLTTVEVVKHRRPR